MPKPVINVFAFVETATLYAVLNEDMGEARRLVGEMLPGERAAFANQLDALRSMLTGQFGNDIGDTERSSEFKEAWRQYFAKFPEVIASWRHQNGYLPEGMDPILDSPKED